MSFWKGKKVLITGHTGFKGSWLSLCLSLSGAKLYGVSLKPKKQSLFIQSDISLFFEKNFFLDIRNKSYLKKALNIINPDIVFHLAAQPLVTEGYLNPVKTFEVNMNGTMNLLESLRHHSSPKVIIIVTTDKVYYPSSNLKKFKETDKLGGYDPYSASKAASEIVSEAFYKSFFKDTDQSIFTVRAGNVIGGGDWSENRLIPDIMKSIKNRITLNIRYPDAVRPWQHVLEPINGYIKLAENFYDKPSCFDTFNFGPNQNNIVSVTKILSLITKKNKNLEFESLEMKKNYENNFLSLDNNKAKKKLKFYPKLNLNSTVDLTYDWYNNFIFKEMDALNLCMNDIKIYKTISNEN